MHPLHPPLRNRLTPSLTSSRNRLTPSLPSCLAALICLFLLSLATLALAAEHEADDVKSSSSPDLDALEARAVAQPDDLRAGAEYRQACIAAEAYDRCLDVFEILATRHPDSHAVQLNWGYAYVDKIPAAGAVTQVILADTALKRFTAAIEIEESWLALYTRGNSYVYWPAIFGRTRFGIADLEKAVATSEALGEEAPAFHAHAYAALGDGHWRLDDLETAREWWRKGLARFPEDGELQRRLALDGEALEEYLDAHYAIGKRVETDLEELWQVETEAR